MSTPEQEFALIEAEEARKEPVEEKTYTPKPLYSVNLDQLTPQLHRWIDRGAVASCEGAGHPSHRVFKLAR